MIGDDPHIFQSQISKEIALIGESRPIIHIRITGAQEHRNLLKCLRCFGIKHGIKPVDSTFQLPADTVIVDRRSQNEHVCTLQLVVDLLHIILLRAFALSLPMTIFASETAVEMTDTACPVFSALSLNTATISAVLP